MEIFTRIIAFPFFAAISLIAAIALWIKWMWNFGKHGGEAIAYTEKMRRKTIQDVFEKLNNEKTEL